jgi:hypothetical protein
MNFILQFLRAKYQKYLHDQKILQQIEAEKRHQAFLELRNRVENRKKKTLKIKAVEYLEKLRESIQEIQETTLTSGKIYLCLCAGGSYSDAYTSEVGYYFSKKACYQSYLKMIVSYFDEHEILSVDQVAYQDPETNEDINFLPYSEYRHFYVQEIKIEDFDVFSSCFLNKD